MKDIEIELKDQLTKNNEIIRVLDSKIMTLSSSEYSKSNSSICELTESKLNIAKVNSDIIEQLIKIQKNMLNL